MKELKFQKLILKNQEQKQVHQNATGGKTEKLERL